MPCSVRWRLRDRVRRSHADIRLHDRGDGGGVLMAAEAPATAPGARSGGLSHGLRIFLIWAVVSLAADLLIWFALGPHLPPGTMSSAATEEQSAIKLMAVMSAPVVVFVIAYFGY